MGRAISSDRSMMDCHDAQHFVQLRIDEEIESIDCVQLDRHLEDCPRCREHVDREAHFQARLELKLHEAAAATCPKGLKDRVRNAIEDEAAEGAFPFGRAVAASLAAV